MRSLLSIAFMLIFVGCWVQPESVRLDVPNEVHSGPNNVSYSVISSLPDAILDEMDWQYAGDSQQWRNEWNEENSTIPIDGQRVLHLVEVACYADIVCHRIEYPLRVATRDYIKRNLDTSEVIESLKWICTSYKCGLSQEVAGDAGGGFKGMIVDAMNVRVVDFANEILRSSEITESNQ